VKDKQNRDSRAEPAAAHSTAAPGVNDAALRINPGVMDPGALGDAFMTVLNRMASDPRGTARAGTDLMLRQSQVTLDMLRSLLDVDKEPVVKPAAGDRRFADRAWTANPFLRGLMESYLVSAGWWRDQVERDDVPAPVRRKARFALNLAIDALAPTNVPLLNPLVLKEAIDTGGLSLVKGARNLVDDLVHNGGMPRQVDRSGFELGKNLACTPGRVVFRNELMELLMYESQTEEVFAEPIVCSPPWINKYYVMDLAPGRSFIEHAVKSGFTVFAISYRNPDASMAGVTMDDYLRQGLLTAIQEARELTGAERVNIVGLCLGGTLAGIALGYLAARGEAEQVGWSAITNTLLDFSEPGELGVFTDAATLEQLEQRMRDKGYLEANSMARTFDWLRGNDLVWNYVVSNWFMGKQPPAFDILAWNSDSTNMPAAMHAQYLRECYLENRLAEAGALRVGGVPIDLSSVRTPMYVLGAEADHIAPWKGTYRTTQLLGGEVRFTLTSSGHIAGIVNPVDNPKSVHWVREGTPPDPEEWRRDAEPRQGSWWLDWREWASARSGAMVPAREVPAGEPAPGRYVRGETGPELRQPRARSRARAGRPSGGSRLRVQAS
jgi:polyhydroxyalkanoate synthase